MLRQLAAAGCALGALTLAAAQGGPAMRHVVPELSDEVLLNPRMGLYLQYPPMDAKPDEWFMEFMDIAYYRMDWAELNPEEGVYKFDEWFGPKLDFWVKQNHKRLAFRVMCQSMHTNARYVTPKWVFDKGVLGVLHKGLYCPEQVDPAFWDERYLELQCEFIRKMGEWFEARGNGDGDLTPRPPLPRDGAAREEGGNGNGDPHPGPLPSRSSELERMGEGEDGIEFIDIGSIGEWGEMHLARWTSEQFEATGYSEAKYVAAYRRIIDAYKTAFPHTQIMLNVGGPNHLCINDYAAIRGVHFRQDGLTPNGASYDCGEWLYKPYSRRGVVCNFEFHSGLDEMNQKGWDLKATLDKGLSAPISYLNTNLGNYRTLPEEARGLLKDAARRIGYRFVVTGVDVVEGFHVDGNGGLTPPPPLPRSELRSALREEGEYGDGKGGLTPLPPLPRGEAAREEGENGDGKGGLTPASELRSAASPSPSTSAAPRPSGEGEHGNGETAQRAVSTTATPPQTTTAGPTGLAGLRARIPVTSTWRNDGVAPCYDSFAIEWSLMNAEGKTVAAEVQYPEVPTTLWWPGEEQTVRTLLRVPRDSPEGEYWLKVAAVLPETGQRIMLGIAGRDDQRRYALCTVQGVEGGAAGGVVYEEGFEDGLGGWDGMQGMTASAEKGMAHSGEAALLVGGRHPEGWNYAGVRLEAGALPACSKVRMTAWMLVEAMEPLGHEPYMKIGVNGADGNWIENYNTNGYDLTRVGEWQKLEVIAELSPGTAGADLCIEKGAFETPITARMWLDDVKVEVLEGP